jgi:hypothetical protein
MKKHIYRGGISILLITVILFSLLPVSCRRSMTPAEQQPTTKDAETIQRAKQWYNDVWKHSPTTSASRVSPYLHDSSYIVNNYANLVLDWRFARVIQQGGATYTEVLAHVPDSLQFKLGSVDSTELLNLLADDEYAETEQSKIVWLLKEAPGADPVAEIVTFVGDYQYTKDNLLRFNTTISYFDLAGYTGSVLYHDRNGQLLRTFQYVRGTLTNTIRCGTEGGLDPDPGNRAHLDVCLEILTYERDCVTTYYQDGTSEKVCGEWFLIGSRMVGNCWASGGGSGGSENYAPKSKDGMDCITFLFTNTAGNWQEGGVMNTRVKILWLGAGPNAVYQYINVTITSPIIIGLPRRRDGVTISPGRAAEIAAWACTQAVALTDAELRRSITRPSNLEIESKFRKQVNNLLLLYNGTASREGSGSPAIFIGNAKYKFFGNGDCDD